jgi:ABC-2 type transport system permease protein
LLVATVPFGISLGSHFVLVPAALVTEVLFLFGICLVVSVINVYFRDVQHLLEIVLLAWFWMPPIVVPIANIAQRLGNDTLWRIYLLNPATALVVSFQRGVYGQATPIAADGQPTPVLVDAPLSWYLSRLGYVAALSVVLIGVGWTIFRRLESRLAEEL